MFACKYADYISREKPLTFKQVSCADHMKYSIKGDRGLKHLNKYEPMCLSLSLLVPHASVQEANDMGDSQPDAAIELHNNLRTNPLATWTFPACAAGCTVQLVYTTTGLVYSKCMMRT